MNTPSVLFIAPSAYTLSGLATWLDYVVPGLDGLGWNTVLGLVEGPKAHQIAPYLQAHPQVHWVSIPCKTGTPRGRRKAVQDVVVRLQPDLLLSVNIPDAIAAVAELRAKGKSKTKVIATCHGIQTDLFSDMRLLKDAMDAVICTNRLACKLAEGIGQWDAQRIFYAGYGTAIPTLRARAKPDVLTLAYVGRLEEDQKRVSDLPIILKQLEQANVPFHLLIAGTGEEEETLRTQLARQLADGSVTFLGYVAPKALADKVYARTDVLLVPSRWETGPIVIWEAMAAGVPVVCARYIGSGLENALEHERNCLMYEIGNRQMAASLIAQLHASEKLWSQLRENGWQMVSRRYSHQASVQRWHDVLLEILSLGDRQLTRLNRQGPTPASRLNQIFGESIGEVLRQQLHRTGPDSTPAGEWPHRLSAQTLNENAFWQQAENADYAFIGGNTTHARN